MFEPTLMETTIDRLNLFNKMFSLVYHDMFVHGFSLFYIVAATTAIYDVCWQNEIFPQQRSENLLDRLYLLDWVGDCFCTQIASVQSC